MIPLPEQPPKEWLDVIEAAVLQWDEKLVNTDTLSEAIYQALYREIMRPPGQWMWRGPRTLYRIRARGLDLTHEGPVSISEVPPP